MNDFIENQLLLWKEAADNYKNLGATLRRRFSLGDFECAVQFNPARIRSTGAVTSKQAIAQRPCFLCAKNRPEEQIAVPAADGWELLLNPFPIFPVHFTIAATSHTPQKKIPFEMASFAERWPELAIFFNGAKAGASAPDHAHCQAVLKSELPIITLAEKLHPFYNQSSIIHTSSTSADLPFHFYSAIIYPDTTGADILRALPQIQGNDAASGRPDPDLVNAIFWMGSEGVLRAIVIPRSAHRPECFYKEGSERILVSPGTIDMAGILILPRKEDFDKITGQDIRNIYSQVAVLP